MVKSDQAIVQRNRRNAQLSTGPRSTHGKAMARRNSLRHGLCANPAAGVAEEAGQFNRLAKELLRHFTPANVIEARLVHRIAVCLWRLQRAARIDGALSTQAAAAVAPQRQEVQDWIRQINAAWQIEVLPETDPRLLQYGAQIDGLTPRKDRHRPVRLGLLTLDGWRERAMMGCGAAITAMLVMLQDLIQTLEQRPMAFLPVEAEKLAWLLGETAAAFPLIDPSALEQGESAGGSRITALIDQARQRKPGTELPPELQSLMANRWATLRQQRSCCENPYTDEQTTLKQTQALLPEDATLDRLIRYERHAERSLFECLERLAKLRHSTVESLAAVVMGQMPDGTTVAVKKQRTRWTNAEPEPQG
ncbi:MAG TPA: hypothetical protein VHP11_14750 [Tepidisphaeraceae bacterium]|nr:hypothetical protein [Tepidisphaeraceae bacterium]